MVRGVDVGMTDHKAGLRRAIHRAGGLTGLPEAPDGPLLERWNARALAQALDQEIARARLMGWPKITLHMDTADAERLARLLRK